MKRQETYSALQVTTTAKLRRLLKNASTKKFKNCVYAELRWRKEQGK